MNFVSESTRSWNLLYKKVPSIPSVIWDWWAISEANQSVSYKEALSPETNICTSLNTKSELKSNPQPATATFNRIFVITKPERTLGSVDIVIKKDTKITL